MSQNLNSFFETIEWDGSNIIRCDCINSNSCLKKIYKFDNPFSHDTITISICSKTFNLILDNFKHECDKYECDRYINTIERFLLLCFNKAMNDLYILNGYSFKWEYNINYRRTQMIENVVLLHNVTHTIINRPFMMISTPLNKYLDIYVDNKHILKYDIMYKTILRELNNIYQSLNKGNKAKTKNVVPYLNQVVYEDFKESYIAQALNNIVELQILSIK